MEMLYMLYFKDIHDQKKGIFIKFYNLLPNQNVENYTKIYLTIADGD